MHLLEAADDRVLLGGRTTAKRSSNGLFKPWTYTATPTALEVTCCSRGDGYPWAPILSDCRGNGSTKLNLKIDAVYKRNAA
jgi:hypothetical protein